MSRKKIALVGAGQIGGTLALLAGNEGAGRDYQAVRVTSLPILSTDRCAQPSLSL